MTGRIALGVLAFVVGVLFVSNALTSAFRRAEQNRCDALVTEGLEHETKMSPRFGCLAKRGDRWVGR